MHIRIQLKYGGIGMDSSTLKVLKRDSPTIAHLSEEDKDLVMKEKDERFKKVSPKPIDTQSDSTDTSVDGGR